MTTVTTIVREEHGLPVAAPVAEQAVSWPAIFAGATAAASLSLILLVLGMGLGFSALSPWASTDTSAQAIAWSTIVWISFAAFASSGVGGYIAGRLRSRWPGAQRDEVYFRDTAHGFLAWGVATLLTAAVFTSVIGVIVGGGDALVAGSADPAAVTQQLAEEARRNAARTSLWIFVSLLVGAFSASWMATFGGRQRDLP